MKKKKQDMFKEKCLDDFIIQDYDKTDRNPISVKLSYFVKNYNLEKIPAPFLCRIIHGLIRVIKFCFREEEEFINKANYYKSQTKEWNKEIIDLTNEIRHLYEQKGLLETTLLITKNQHEKSVEEIKRQEKVIFRLKEKNKKLQMDLVTPRIEASALVEGVDTTSGTNPDAPGIPIDQNPIPMKELSNNNNNQNINKEEEEEEKDFKQVCREIDERGYISYPNKEQFNSGEIRFSTDGYGTNNRNSLPVEETSFQKMVNWIEDKPSSVPRFYSKEKNLKLKIDVDEEINFRFRIIMNSIREKSVKNFVCLNKEQFEELVKFIKTFAIDPVGNNK